MNSWILDIDGVITNLLNQRPEKQEIYDILTTKLDSGETLGFITGRALPWVEENIIPLIKAKSLDNFFLATEFASVITTFHGQTPAKYIDPKNEVPENIKIAAVKIAEKHKKHILHEEKEVIVSFRMNKASTLGEFKKAQKKFASELRQLLDKNKLAGEYEVLADALGTNIRRIGDNKSTAVDQFLSWQKEKGVDPDKYYVFGDSDSDLEMGDELKKQNKNFEFIYVGHELEKKPDYPVTYSKKQNDEGTLEFLLSL